MTGAPSLLDIPFEPLSIESIGGVLTAMPTLADSRWATAQPSGNSSSDTGYYGWPDPYAPTYCFSTRAPENARPALFEAAPTSFSGFSNRENTASSWEASVNSFPSTAPTQSDQFSGFNPGQNAPSASAYGPPHLRNRVPIQIAQVPSWSNENMQPTQPPSQPKQEEKKVKYLKDSMWAC